MSTFGAEPATLFRAPNHRAALQGRKGGPRGRCASAHGAPIRLYLQDNGRPASEPLAENTARSSSNLGGGSLSALMIVVFGRGIWRPATPEPAPVAHDDPTFHVFASEWLEAKRHEGLGERTLLDYEWSLAYHLLPFFSRHRLLAITVREVIVTRQQRHGSGRRSKPGGRPVRSASRLVCPRTQQTRPSSGSRRSWKSPSSTGCSRATPLVAGDADSRRAPGRAVR